MWADPNTRASFRFASLSGFFLLGSALAFGNTVFAECKRFPANQNGVDDGPGTLGPLHGTMTLDCLRFVGMQQQDGEVWGIVKDDQGKKYRVHAGSAIAHGVVKHISETRMIVDVFVEKNGDWHIIQQTMPRVK